jgi:hypothetical protein
MIIMAIGTPIPSAAPIMFASADSRPIPLRNSPRPDMPLLHEAPTSNRPSPRDERYKIPGRLNVYG